jgi:hypothetical protein
LPLGLLYFVQEGGKACCRRSQGVVPEVAARHVYLLDSIVASAMKEARAAFA